MSLLSIRGLSKSYGGVAALRDASLEVDAGEVHALMGENGAGKSTLIKILAGAVRADAGEFAVNGLPVSISSARDAHRLGLRFLHQELNVLPRLSVAENLFLGRAYPTRFAGLIDWRALHDRARAALAGLDVARYRARDHPRSAVDRRSDGRQDRFNLRRGRVGAGPPLRHGRTDRRPFERGSRAAVSHHRRAQAPRPRNHLCLAPDRRGAEDQRSHHSLRDGTSQAPIPTAQSDPGVADRSHDRPRGDLGTAAVARRSLAAIPSRWPCRE